MVYLASQSEDFSWSDCILVLKESDTSIKLLVSIVDKLLDKIMLLLHLVFVTVNSYFVTIDCIKYVHLINLGFLHLLRIIVICR